VKEKKKTHSVGEEKKGSGGRLQLRGKGKKAPERHEWGRKGKNV